MTVHEVEHGGKLKEIHPPTGGVWGAVTITDRFLAFMSEIFGCSIETKLSSTELLNLEAQFENLMVSMSAKEGSRDLDSFFITIPESLYTASGLAYKNGYNVNLEGRKLFFDVKTMAGFFRGTFDSIFQSMKRVLSDTRSQSVRYAVLVGGFSRCALLQKSLQQLFPLLKVLIPVEADAIAAKGAVMFARNPNMIHWRISPRTYGIRKQSRFVHGTHDKKRLRVIEGDEKCLDIFDVYVQKDELLEQTLVTECKTYRPVHQDQTVMRLRVYSADVRSPLYTTEPGCRKIGNILVHLPNTTKGKERRVRVKMVFGGTELQVKAVDEDTGTKYIAAFDFLHNV